MASEIWWIVVFLIFWLVTSAGISLLFLWLLKQQRAEAAARLSATANLLEASSREQAKLYEKTIAQLEDSSADSLESARDQAQKTIEMQQAMAAEAIKQATFGTSSANQTLSDLTRSLIPILAAKDPIAAGQLSTLTDPAEQRQDLYGTPYTAEEDTTAAAIAQQIDEQMARLTGAGIDPDTARSAATSSVLLPQL